MKKFIILLACAISAQVAAVAYGAEAGTKDKTFALAVATQSMESSTIALRILLKDAKPKTGVCPYYVRSLQYLAAVHVLNVEVYQENCFNDAYGVSQGQILWIAPKSLQSKSTQLTVLINQAEAGALAFDDTKQSFYVKGE